MCSSGLRKKNKRKRKDKQIRELKKTLEYEGDGETDYSWSTWNVGVKYSPVGK